MVDKLETGRPPLNDLIGSVEDVVFGNGTNELPEVTVTLDPCLARLRPKDRMTLAVEVICARIGVVL